MAAINAQQIKKIYAIGNSLGIVERGNDEDDLHAMVSAMTGKDSIKTLTYREAEDIIARLQHQQGGAAPRKSNRQHPERAGGVTSGQQKKAWALMYQLQSYDQAPNATPLGERLCAIIKKELGIDARTQNPFIWMDFKAGNKLLEVLKGYVSTAKKKAGDPS